MNEIAIFKALSDRNRLRIVSALMKHEELCAHQLTELIQATGATASRHMGVLISSGLADSHKEGRRVYYRPCRGQADLSVLIGWIESRIDNDPDAAFDVKRLEEITAYTPPAGFAENNVAMNVVKI